MADSCGMAEGGIPSRSGSTFILQNVSTAVQLEDLLKSVSDERNGGKGDDVSMDILLNFDGKSSKNGIFYHF